MFPQHHAQRREDQVSWLRVHPAWNRMRSLDGKMLEDYTNTARDMKIGPPDAVDENS